MKKSQTSSSLVSLGHNLSIFPGALTERAKAILTPEVVALLSKFHTEFEEERQNLLRERKVRQKRYDQGELPDYLPPSNLPPEFAKADWKVAPLPADLLQRRVEITGPVSSAKMVINMLSRNSEGDRADTAMLDFEDSMKPSWGNVVEGVHNVIGAARGDLNFSAGSKSYALNPEDMALVMVRVRGLHLNETNIQINNTPISGGMFDLVLCFYHTARILKSQGKTPKYYVPKCEHHLEARWWEKLFCALETACDFPAGTLRATFLIETLEAAFQMEEILFETRKHVAGLNTGRWDKIFSDIKVLKNHPDKVFADRATINLKKPWMENYAKRLVKICHRRGAAAMGGMAAFTPGKTEELRKEQTRKVLEDKNLEAGWGHDGCWVSHPYFIGTALAAFTNSNQLHVQLENFPERPNLIPQGTGPRTMQGLRTNIRVGIAYLWGWNNDQGCIAWDNLMEDLATLEISRAQTWQWLHHGITLDDGPKVTPQLVAQIFDEELARILDELHHEGPSTASQFQKAHEVAQALFLQPDLKDFLATESEPAVK